MPSHYYQNVFIEANNCMLTNVYLSQEIVRNKLIQLKVNKAPGIGELVPRLQVENVDFISEPLSYLYKEPLDNKTVPKDWKLANVTAVFKKGQRELPCDYRQRLTRL